MLVVGDSFPDYSLNASISVDREAGFSDINEKSHEGKWRVIFFWPNDFTVVCPTELATFGRLNSDFTDRDAQVLGVSVDSKFVHLAWRTSHQELRDLPFPMLSDAKRDLSLACGVLGPDGVAQRATFIVDQNNIVQFVMVTSSSVGRNVHEVLRVLDALQTDELCPCNWKRGDKTLDVYGIDILATT